MGVVENDGKKGERMSKKSIYIAGPMRGKPYYNFPAFDIAAMKLMSDGWVVISPADMDRRNGFDAMQLPPDADWCAIPPGFDFNECIDRDIAAVKQCDAMFLLYGWQDSAGARAEHALAEWMGKQILCEVPPEEQRVIDPDTGGQKGLKLARYDLIPSGPLKELAEHYGKNCKTHGGKYDDNNWRKGYSWHLSYRSAIGHLQEFWAGIDRDPENGSKSVIAAAWHCIALAEFMDTHPEKDDRWQKQGGNA